jgi:hypothetical protein
MPCPARVPQGTGGALGREWAVAARRWLRPGRAG